MHSNSFYRLSVRGRRTQRVLKLEAADSQVRLEFLVRELGSMRFANFPSIRVGLPYGRGSLLLDFDCPFSFIAVV